MIPYNQITLSKIYMNDYNYICDDIDPETDKKTIITPQQTTIKHISDYNYILNEVKNADKNIIVVTHHLPSFDLIDEKYKNFSLNCCFASNCEISNDLLKLWICGHSHTSISFTKNNTTYAINSYGYKNGKTNENQKYNRSNFFIVDK